MSHSVWTNRTRLEKELTTEAVERGRHDAAGDLTVEGPTLAKDAFRLGVVDIVELLLCPVTVGGGTKVFPNDLTLNLRQTRERRFNNGMVQVTYETMRT
jgi:dihydrofolate reductase